MPRLAIVALIALLGYGISLAYVYFDQDELIYMPRPVSAKTVAALNADTNVESLRIQTADGNTLSGWLVNTDRAQKKPLVLYYGGNAEEVSDMVTTASKNSNAVWALVNYRGYGASTGSPSEANLFADSLLVYDALSTRQGIDSTNISVFGKSIGSGVAVYVAQQRRVSRVLLATPYDSVTSVAQEKYPFFPVGLLLKHKFDSLSRAKDIHVPVLILAAGDDKIIPVSHAATLAEAFGDYGTYRIIPGAGHNTIVNTPSYNSAVEAFLGGRS
jgi:pimeloyl-ACP methyl ester carboxylesterase